MKNWTIVKLIVVGAIAVLDILFWYVAIFPFFGATGSVFGASLALIVDPFFAVLVALVTKQFGAVFLFALLAGILALPIPSVLPKPLNFIMEPGKGLILDTLSLFLMQKSEKSFSFLAGVIFNFILSLEMTIFYFAVGLPGFPVIPPSFIIPAVIIVIVTLSMIGGVSGLLSFVAYQKIAETTVVKRIQGSK